MTTFKTAAATALTLWASNAGAQVGGAPSLPGLINRADLIVAGTRLEVADKSPGHIVETMRVDRILKGSLPNNSAVFELGEREATSAAPPMAPRYGLYFLRREGHNWVGAMPHLMRLMAAPQKYQRFAPPSNTICQVGAELATAFFVPPDEAIDPNIGLAPSSMLVPPTTSRHVLDTDDEHWAPASKTRLAEEVYIQAWSFLRYVPNDCKHSYLLGIVEGGAPLYGRVWANSILWRMGDFSRFEYTLPYLMRPDDEATGTNSGLNSALESKVFPDSFAQMFVRLLRSSNLYIRRGASYQIAHINTPTTTTALPPLLRDADSEIRMNAVFGVCLRSHGCNGYTPEELTKLDNVPKTVAILEKWQRGSAAK